MLPTSDIPKPAIISEYKSEAPVLRMKKEDPEKIKDSIENIASIVGAVGSDSSFDS